MQVKVVKIDKEMAVLNYCPVCKNANNLKYLKELDELKCSKCAASFDVISGESKNRKYFEKYKLLEVENAD